MRWAKTTGDLQLSDLGLLPTVAALLKRLATTSATSAGYRFWPGVHEIQGGMAMKAICEAVG